MKIISDINRLNGMNRIHDKEVNNISGCNLLHDILDPSKHTKKYKCPLLYYSTWMYQYTKG